MKRSVALAVVCLAVVAGCGGSSQHHSSASASSTTGATGPARQFEASGTSTKADGSKASSVKAVRTDPNGDTYVHAHLDMGWLDHCLTNDQQVDWATTSSGACYGDFKDGSYPFTGGRGAWSQWFKRDGRINITMATMHLPDDPAASQREIECHIPDRSSGQCDTDGGSHLELKVVSGDYLLLRGWCHEGDSTCTPHQYGGRPSLKG